MFTLCRDIVLQESSGYQKAPETAAKKLMEFIDSVQLIKARELTGRQVCTTEKAPLEVTLGERMKTAILNFIDKFHSWFASQERADELKAQIKTRTKLLDGLDLVNLVTKNAKLAVENLEKCGKERNNIVYLKVVFTDLVTLHLMINLERLNLVKFSSDFALRSVQSTIKLYREGHKEEDPLLSLKSLFDLQVHAIDRYTLERGAIKMTEHNYLLIAYRSYSPCLLQGDNDTLVDLLKAIGDRDHFEEKFDALIDQIKAGRILTNGKQISSAEEAESIKRELQELKAFLKSHQDEFLQSLRASGTTPAGSSAAPDQR